MLIQDALNLTVNELYERIGKDVLTGVAMGDLEPEEYQNRGIRWSNKYRHAFQEAICNSQVAHVCLGENRSWDQVLLVAAISDLISSLSLGVSPVTVATLLVKEGLIKLCPKET